MKPDHKKPQATVISKQKARIFLLDHHYLLPPKRITEGQIVAELFSRLGCIQFDTINVVGRNADLVLQSRVKDYRPEILERLLYQDRVLTDGWDKVASIYPTKDWPFFDRHRTHMGERRHRRSSEASAATENVLNLIKEKGALSSLDFKDHSKTDWSWGPTSIGRAALEILLAEGKVGISHRVNTRRHFDLVERLIPAPILRQEDPNPSEQAYQEWHVLRRIGSMGIASPKSGEHWLGIYGADKVPGRNQILNRLLQKGQATLINIEGLDGQEFYIRTEDLERLGNLNHPPAPKTATFIAPLDNLLWNRKLIKDLFDFEYTWEVYKPKENREYGYYVLPVLLGSNFIGRVDLKFDRKSKTLNLTNWWWEPQINKDPEMLATIRNCFEDFLNHLDAQALTITEENLTAPEIVDVLQKLM